MTAWFAFWIAVSVFIICEAVIFIGGADTFIWQYKTEAEKKLQEQRITKGGAS